MANGKAKNEGNYVLLRSERRANLRKQILVLQVKGKDQKGVFFGYAKTIGRGGMFISSVNPRKPAEEFEITFSLPKTGREITCRCSVVWQREFDPEKKHEPGMGIKFLDMKEEDRELIAEWMKKLKK